MPPTPPQHPVTPAAERANEQLRAYVRAHGGRPWTRDELSELDRLRRVWLEAERGYVRAA